MKTYEMAVVVQTITVRAESPEQAEEMYNRWHGGPVRRVCPHHPDVTVHDSDWECGCATGDDEVYHITTELKEVRV